MVNLKITDKETARLVKHNKTTQIEAHTLFVYLTTLHVVCLNKQTLLGQDSERKLIVLL